MGGGTVAAWRWWGQSGDPGLPWSHASTPGLGRRHAKRCMIQTINRHVTLQSWRRAAACVEQMSLGRSGPQPLTFCAQNLSCVTAARPSWQKWVSRQAAGKLSWASVTSFKSSAVDWGGHGKLLCHDIFLPVVLLLYRSVCLQHCTKCMWHLAVVQVAWWGVTEGAETVEVTAAGLTASSSSETCSSCPADPRRGESRVVSDQSNGKLSAPCVHRFPSMI